MEKWESWPPEEHRERLDGYARYRKIFKGEHGDVFERLQSKLEKLDPKKKLAVYYTVCNFAALISKICADLLFGEEPRFVVGDEDSKEQQAIERIVRDNNLNTTNYEMALSNSWRADAVYKVRFGKFRSWLDDTQSIIESVPAHVFFPHLDGDNIQEMTGATLAWVKRDGNKRYLRKEIHLPGKIINELWKLDGHKIAGQVDLKTLDQYKDLKPEEDTGFKGILVEHVPNWRLDDEFFGISDYFDLESMFDSLNNRLSKIDEVLDKHSGPHLILPPGIMEYDESTGLYYVKKEDLEVMEIDRSNESVGDLPKYLVWDAQLDAAFKQIDKIIEMLMMLSETSPAAFGMDKEGVAESGRALKFKLLRTLAKINRKKLYFNQGLQNALYMAQELDCTHGSGTYEPKLPTIEWKDGLPQDEQERAEIDTTEYSGGITSLERLLQKRGLRGKELEDELKRIKEEEGSPTAPGDPLNPVKPRIELPPRGGEE